MTKNGQGQLSNFAPPRFIILTVSGKFQQPINITQIISSNALKFVFIKCHDTFVYISILYCFTSNAQPKSNVRR